MGFCFQYIVLVYLFQYHNYCNKVNKLLDQKHSFNISSFNKSSSCSVPTMGYCIRHKLTLQQKREKKCSLFIQAASKDYMYMQKNIYKILAPIIDGLRPKKKSLVLNLGRNIHWSFNDVITTYSVVK